MIVKNFVKGFILILVVTIAILAFEEQAFAIPTLQLYIEGAGYDVEAETWVIESYDFMLWVIGDVGSYGTISGVKLAIAYDSGETGSVAFTPTTATPGLLPAPGDPSPASALGFLDNGADVPPLDGDGKPVPPHDIYGPGISWETYLLGDFILTDSPIGDYTNGGPSSFPALGQIDAYSVSVSGYPLVHFDTFDHVVVGQNKAKYVFAPFSHDAEVIPEPATLSLLGLGLLGLARFRKKRK